ncbi:MAG: hypothetical protein NTX22_16020 [Ignavibacteriales bacterium]|nr:hypothetical protein [Ignavibacteriales bacterium]
MKFFKKKESKRIEFGSSFKEMEEVQREASSLGKEGEVYAAIGLAIHLYLKDVHDYESMMLTMQRVIRPYSPWSSKIYSLRQNPRR